MKIAIISDLHLGFRQYGSLERENDFYKQFHKVCNEINQYDPNMVIIAGDLFDKPTPSPAAINAYKIGINSLVAKDIFTIKGNHTMILRDNHYSIDDFFGSDEIEDYHFLDDSRGIINNVQIDGITYRTNSNIDEFLEIQKKMAQTCSKDNYNILVVHQSFKEFCGFTGEELSITDIDLSNYNAIICGHIHSRFDVVLSDGVKFIQPGSIERLNTLEALDEHKNGKGFYLLDTEKNSLEFHKVECDRDFFLGEINLESREDLQNHLENLNDILDKLENPPIISYTYVNNGLNIDEVREKIGLVKDNVLLNKSNIDDRTEEEVIIEILDDEMPTVLEAIKMFGEKSGLKEEECILAADLHNTINNNIENVDGVLNKYFKKDKEEYKKTYEKDKELEECIKYFGGE